MCLGDIMGSSISGIENLLKMPYGCGEQNMINFAPSMFIRAYLKTVEQLTPSIDKKSIRFMTSGESGITQNSTSCFSVTKFKNYFFENYS